MNKTKFKDVAHLYLGCFIQTKEGVGNMSGLYTLTGEEPIVSYNLVRAYLNFEDVKPILRSLSAIGGRELETYLGMEADATLYANRETEIQSRAYSPSSLVYLISRGFDLFGLIDSGEALDADKLDRSPYTT